MISLLSCGAIVGLVGDALLVRKALCESAACANVWLDPFPPTAATSAHGTTEECYQLVNTTACMDCAKDAGVCSHLLFYTQPQPISSQFAFCSGHNSRSSDVSLVRWMSFIGWRNDACPTALAQSAWSCRRQSLAESTWLPFYQKGTVGFTPQMDVPCQ